MTSSAVAENDDAVGSIKCSGLFWPTLELACLKPKATSFQRRGKHRITLHVIVRLTVFPAIREKHDLLLFSQGPTGEQKSNQRD